MVEAAARRTGHGRLARNPWISSSVIPRMSTSTAPSPRAVARMLLFSEMIRFIGTARTPGRDGGSDPGQLAMRLPNPQAMLGYWEDPERTAQARIQGPDGEWFLTGDMAMVGS